MPMPITECDGCGTRMRPDVVGIQTVRLSEHVTSRVECTHCGRKLGTINWETL